MLPATILSELSTVVTGFLGFIFSIYLLLGKEQLQNQGRRLMDSYLPGKWVEKLSYLLKVLDDSFHRYIVGQCTEAIILGVLCMAGMLILGVPYAPMIGTLIGFTALIPVAGAYYGVPIAGALYRLLREDMNRREKKAVPETEQE